jgi:GT2 family glycosyltransferase/glycosyltransferase involved in cell wall biosynthesis
LEQAYVISYDYSVVIFKRVYAFLSINQIQKLPNPSRFGLKKKALKSILRTIAFALIPIGLVRLIYTKVSSFFARSQSREKSVRIRFGVIDSAIVIFAPIDWHYRHQRPQNLAEAYSKIGKLVFYINPTVEYKAGFQDEIYSEQIEGVWVCTIRSSLSRKNFYIGVDGFPQKLAESVSKLIEDAISTKSNSSALLLVQQPSWWPLVERLQGNQIVFDCMDFHAGFAEIDPLNISLESALDASSDQIVVTSEFLATSKRNQIHGPSQVKVIRNGVDVNRFVLSSKSEEKNVIGYFGALAEWFDIDLMDLLISQNRQLRFEIIGLISNSQIKDQLGKHANVAFLGEVPNEKLPGLVGTWAVGLIPFKLSPLILATNPVKMYEYASMGIPTVATLIPEVALVSNRVSGIYVSKDFEEFNTNLKTAMNLSDQDREELISWGKNQDWSQRAAAILEHTQVLPKVSVIVLMWNQGLMTLRCLQSLIDRSDYRNLEIIVVDNDSKPQESVIVTNWLDAHATHKIKYIKNLENLGFAAGNNVGLSQAKGDYLVILNNDTEVSPGWIWRSLKHFYRNSNLGILGPSTNNCGNEGRVKLRGNPNDWLSEVVPRFNFRVPHLLEVNTAAFFCVFIPRKVYEEVGMISTDYGRGYFEDDDYCRRVQSLGYQIGIARDVFIHHKMGASFDLLEDSEKTRLFNANKAIYEAKWGKWIPHSYALDSDQS